MIPSIVHAIGVVLFAAMWLGLIVALARWVRLAPAGGTGSACEPAEVLHLLALDLRGQVEAAPTGSLLRGSVKGRAVTIQPLLTCYDVTLDTGLGGFTLSAEEAIAHLARAAGTDEEKGIAALLAGDPDWRAMDKIFHAHHVRFEPGCVRARVDLGGGVLGPRAEADRVWRFLERLNTVAAAVGSLGGLRLRETADSRCPYCHDAFAEGAPTTGCSRCGTLHHTECLSEHGKCAVFACGPQPVRVPGA